MLASAIWTERDGAGNWSSNGEFTVYIDASSPFSGPVIFKIASNSGTSATLEFYAPTATEMYISNSGCQSGGAWEGFASSKSWTLTQLGDGSAIVYVNFKNSAGQISDCLSHRVGVSGAISAEGASCAAILNAGQSRGNGIYLIDPDGGGSLSSENHFCNMTYAGGGWTLVTRTFASNTDLLNRIPSASEYRSLTSVGSLTNHKYILGNDRQGFAVWGAVVNGSVLNPVADFGGNLQKFINHIGGSTYRGCNWQGGNGSFVIATTNGGACIKFATGTNAEGGGWLGASDGGYWGALMIQGHIHWASGNYPPFNLNIIAGADNNYCSIMQYGTITFGHGYTLSVCEPRRGSSA